MATERELEEALIGWAMQNLLNPLTRCPVEGCPRPATFLTGYYNKKRSQYWCDVHVPPRQRATEVCDAKGSRIAWELQQLREQKPEPPYQTRYDMLDLEEP